MRAVVVLLGIAISTVSCQALGVGGGTTIVMGLLAVSLAWLVGPRVASAGGGGTGTAGETSTTGPSGTTADEGGTAAEESTGTTAADTGGTTVEDGTATEGTEDDGEIETGVCLSIDMPEPEMTVCLCACDQGEEPDDWAPAGILPLILLARSRRRSLDRLADQGRLPPDVVARLREREAASEHGLLLDPRTATEAAADRASGCGAKNDPAEDSGDAHPPP